MTWRPHRHTPGAGRVRLTERNDVDFVLDPRGRWSEVRVKPGLKRMRQILDKVRGRRED